MTKTIAIIGLGYVGLPLAMEFGKTFRTIGFDHSEARVASLNAGVDPNGEVASEALAAAVRKCGRSVRRGLYV